MTLRAMRKFTCLIPRHFAAYRRLFLLSILLLDVAWCNAANGTFVQNGQPRPKPDYLRVRAGQPAMLDLLLGASLPAENQCRTTLYALGGPLAAQVSQQTGRLVFSADGKTGYRTALSIDIPSSRPGARFLLKTECLSPSPQLLGTIELRVPDIDPLDEIRSGLAGREVQITGRSRTLRALLTSWKIPFQDRANPVPGTIIFTEEPGGAGQEVTAPPGILVELKTASGETLILTAQPTGVGWKIEAQLPRSHDLSSPDVSEHLAEIIRFIRKLETPTKPI
jgi:hypothetical protein